ncbi:sensor histidine kinase [Verrucomicrobiota bacterium]
MLIADDDLDLTEMLKIFLSDCGKEVVVVHDGRKALELFESPEAPRLALLDWNMPELNGLELCKILRDKDKEKSQHTYIIMLTGNCNEDDVIAGLEAGADDFMAKPFNLEELKQRIEIGARLIEYETKLSEKNKLLEKEIHERKLLEEEQIKLERSLAEARRLESIGTLAAGIAHEINTPIQFVSDNVQFLSNSANDLTAALKANDAQTEEKAIDLPFLTEEIPKATEQTLEGLKRVTEIVSAMKSFSRTDDLSVKSPTDINKAIEDTVTVSSHEWKDVAEIKMDLDPSLPMVSCFAGELKQVLINLITNAAKAIADTKTFSKGTITISSTHDDNQVMIKVSDTGPGIPEEIRDKIFDPFFTTRKIGEGIGQGLSYAYSSITNRHEGKLTFETETGKGTTFVIQLPLN